MARQMTARNWAILVLLSVVWGSSFLGSEIILQEMSPIAMVTWRLGIAALILAVVVATGPGFPRDKDFWRKIALIGLFNSALPFALISYGQTKLTGSHASILNSTVPLWAVIIAPAFLSDEELTYRRFFGVLLGLVGIVIMAGSGALKGFSEGVLPQLAIIAATLCYAFAAVFTRKWLSHYSGKAVAGCSVICGFAYMLAYALLNHTELYSPNWHVTTFTWVLVLGAICTALAYILFFTLLREAGPSNATLVTLLVPVTASILCYLVLGQELTTTQLIGMILILIALLIIDNRLPRIFNRKVRV